MEASSRLQASIHLPMSKESLEPIGEEARWAQSLSEHCGEEKIFCDVNQTLDSTFIKFVTYDLIWIFRKKASRKKREGKHTETATV
jgi:hypothetical protein